MISRWYQAADTCFRRYSSNTARWGGRYTGARLGEGRRSCVTASLHCRCWHWRPSKAGGIITSVYTV